MRKDPCVGHVSHRDPRFVGDSGELVDHPELPLVRLSRHVEPLRDRAGPLLRCTLCPRPCRDVLALPVLTGQPPAVQGAPHDHAHPVALTRREDVKLDRPGEDRIGRLLAYEPFEVAALTYPVRLDDHVSRERGAPDVPDLSLADEVGERTQRLFEVDLGPRSVDLVQIDVVGAESPEAVLDLFHDPVAGVPLIVDALAHASVDLRRQHDLVPAPGDRLGDDLFRFTARIDIGRIDEIDPAVQRRLDDPDRIVVVRVAPRPEHHRAEAVGADLDPGVAELPVLHPYLPENGVRASLSL